MSEPTTATATAAGGRHRRLLTGALATALVVAIAVGTAVGWYADNSAREWRGLALRHADDLRTSRSMLVAAAAQLAAGRRTVTATQAQLRALTGQVHQVANAKAQAEDRQALAQQFAQKLNTIASAQTRVGAALSACITDQRQLIDSTLALVRALESGRPGNTAAVAPQIDQVNRSCGQAAHQEQSLQALITTLNR